MPSDDSPLVYLILGAAGSGRREIIADLLEGGLNPGEKAAVLVAHTESAAPGDSRLAERALVVPWQWTEDRIEAAIPAGANIIFFLSHGHANPVDQTEAFKAWLDAAGLRLGRILSVVDCHLAEAHPPMLLWYDACVHFADVVLFTHREGVANKWFSDFKARFQQAHFPCLFETVKAGTVRNPALVLAPQALRISHAFDEEPDWVVIDADGNALPDVDPDDEDTDEEVHMQPAVDPYFERLNGGRRVKEIPDIRKVLQNLPAPTKPA